MQKTQTLKMSTQTHQVPITIILMTTVPCRFPFLQKLQLFNNHFLKTPALKITILELQVPATFFLTTSALKINILELQVLATTILRMCSHCGMSFLQNNQLFNHHILKSILELRVPATLFLTIACMSLLSLQIPATIFLMTSSQCRSPFLQNIQLFNLHQSPSNLICQGRRRRPALAFLQNEHLQTSQPSTPMPSTSTAPTPR